jgi:hypothetical protein
MLSLQENNKVYNNVLIGQLLLFFFLFVCLALIPHFLFETNEGGISNYAIYAKTVVPFSLSTISGALFALIACQHLGDKPEASKKLKLYLRIWAFFALISLISTYPYKLSPILGHIHEYIAILFVFYEIWFAGWMTFRLIKDNFNFLAWSFQIVGFIFGILNNFGVVHILFVVEVWEGLAFALILVHSCKNVYKLKNNNYTYASNKKRVATWEKLKKF